MTVLFIAKKRRYCNTFLVSADGLNDVCFSSGHTRGSFCQPSALPVQDTSLDKSWAFYNLMGAGEGGAGLPSNVRNPNKAIVTIDAKNTKVIINFQLYLLSV